MDVADKKCSSLQNCPMWERYPPSMPFSNTLGEGNERSLIGKTTAPCAEDIQFESESTVEVVSNVLTLIDIECYNLTRL